MSIGVGLGKQHRLVAVESSPNGGVVAWVRRPQDLQPSIALPRHSQPEHRHLAIGRPDRAAVSAANIAHFGPGRYALGQIPGDGASFW